MTKFAESRRFGYIYWRNPSWKTSFSVQWFLCIFVFMRAFYHSISQVESILILKVTIIPNMVPFMVLSDTVYFESTVIGYSKGSSVIDSYHGLSVLFLSTHFHYYLRVSHQGSCSKQFWFKSVTEFNCYVDILFIDWKCRIKNYKN